MPSLNQYGSRIAGILGRQADHAMIERAKDAFKAVFATRIRQSVSKNGIDDVLTLTCELPVISDTTISIPNFNIFKTNVKVPVPVRFNNDAVFTKVTCDLFPDLSFCAKSLIEIRLAKNYDVNGFNRYYLYNNGVLKLFSKYVSGDLSLNTTTISKVYLTSIFENPEEVVVAYSTGTSQDVELPFPNDMLESILLEVLKTEFNFVPPEVEVKS